MATSCDFNNLATGDQIGYSFQASVTATNDDMGAVELKLWLIDPNATPPSNSQSVSIPAGTAGGTYTFSLSHTAMQNDDEIELKLTHKDNPATVYDSDVVSLVDVVATAGIVIGVVPALTALGELVATTVSGTYRKEQPVTNDEWVYVVISKKKKGNQPQKRHKVLAIVPAELIRADSTWRATLPNVNADSGRLYIRAYLVKSNGKVIATASKRIGS